MSAWIKLVMWFVLLFVAVGGICMVTGGVAAFSMKDDLVAMNGATDSAKADIKAATGLEAQLGVSISKKNSLKVAEVVVHYPFIPPNADRTRLYWVADAAVRRHFKNLISVGVAGLPRPSGPPPADLLPQPAAAPAPVAAPAAPGSAPVDPAVAVAAAPPPAAAPEAKGKGKLTLASVPTGAVVMLEGKALGKTPLVKASVPAGTQLLTLVFPDGSTRTFSAKIAPNKLAKFKVRKNELPD